MVLDEENSNPLVSIIMNCFNGEKYLSLALESIYAQSYSNWEVIFWDNASIDNSSDIALSYDKRIKYFLAPQTTSLGQARKQAITKISGKYIAFLDCDDLYLPKKLEIQVKQMEISDYAMSYGSAYFINEVGKEIRRVTVKNKSGYVFGQLLEHYEINMQSVMLRYSVLAAENLSFSAKLKYCPDYKLFMEIASIYPVGVLKDFVVKTRIHDDSLSKKTVSIASSEIKLTLDNILAKTPEMRHNFSKEFDSAYNKLHFYDALSAIYLNDRRLARQYLKPVINSKLQYLLVYLLLLLPVSNQKILKYLGR